MGKYISVSEKLIIYNNIDETILVVENLYLRKGQKRFKINNDTKEIILLLNGNYTFDDIVIILSNKYNESVIDIEKKFKKFIDILKTEYNFEIIYTEKKLDKKIMEHGNGESIYPGVVSIEVTNICNAKCLHCYGEYSNTNSQVMDLSKFKKIATDCKNMGVELIELTGGEVSIYPYINEALKYLYELDFNRISLLTNGIFRNLELYNLIISEKHKVVVQIDLHGYEDNYINWFMGTNIYNITNKIMDNIKYLHHNGVFTRIACIITPRNLDQIELIADWVHSLGIKSFGISPVIQMGRATGNSSQLIISEIEEIKKINNIVDNIINKFGEKFIMIDSVGNIKRKNCGALVSNPTVDPLGNLKICSVDSLSSIRSIGNIFDTPINDLYNNNVELITLFKNTEPPDLNSIECSVCDSKLFCSGCLLRGFINGKERGDDCKWFKEEVPLLIKEKLLK